MKSKSSILFTIFMIFSLYSTLGMHSISIGSADVDSFTMKPLTDNPIEINGNEELHQMASENGWIGNGTEQNPITISGYNIIDSSDEGITIISTTDYIQIINNSFSTLGSRHGILIQNTENIVVTNNTIFDTDIGIYIIYSTINLSGNHIESSRNQGIKVYGGQNCVIDNNYFELNQAEGIEVYNSNNCEIKGNNFNQNSGNAIYIVNSDKFNLTNNIVTYTQYGTGIVIDESTNIYIGANKIAGNANGISIYGFSENVLIESNLILDNSIDIDYGPTNVIIRNNTISSIWAGIYLSNDFGYGLVENNFIINSQEGIWVFSSHNLIRNNIFYSLNTAIIIEQGSNNEFFNNSFESIIGPEILIYGERAINNTFYLNSFLDHNDNLQIDTSGNNFDYLTIGNFWSNYIGVDLNEDDIGDQNFVVGYINGPTIDPIYDEFPLMNPTVIINNTIFFEINVQITTLRSNTPAGYNVYYPQTVTETSQFVYSTDPFDFTTHPNEYTVTSGEAYTSFSQSGGLFSSPVFSILILILIGLGLYSYSKWNNNKLLIEKYPKPPQVKKFCLDCGFKVEFGDQYCENCGKRII